jgi:hypothetical protein
VNCPAEPGRPDQLTLSSVCSGPAEDVKAPRKQHHTIRHIVQRLRDEHGLDGASYTTVNNYVNRPRTQGTAEQLGQWSLLAGMVAQLHEPGAEAEVDFCDVWVRLGDAPERHRAGNRRGHQAVARPDHVRKR